METTLQTALVPPNHEMAVIGAIFQYPLGLEICRKKGLTADHFGNPQCQCVYTHIVQLSARGKGKFDIPSAAMVLQETECFRGTKLEEITATLLEWYTQSDPSLLDFYIEVVLEHKIYRDLDLAADKIKHGIRNRLTPLADVVAAAESAVLTATEGYLPERTELTGKARRMYNRQHPMAVRGFNSGFPLLDKLTTGFGGGRTSFALFFGHSHVGKSMILQQILLALCNPRLNDLGGKRIAVAPTEMTPDEWKDRLLSFMLNINTLLIQTGDLESAYVFRGKNSVEINMIYDEANDRVENLPIDWVENEHRKITGKDALAYAKTGKYAALFFDGIKDAGADPDVESSRESTYSRVYNTCQALHIAAHNYHTPVFATNQLKSMDKVRYDKRPTPEDLFGGKDCYELSTFSAALYRDSQHKFTYASDDEKMTEEEKRRAIMFVHKDRYGIAAQKAIRMQKRGNDSMGFDEKEVIDD